uniref:Phosphoenolpyruvate synthase n=2 Tax=Clastoptera arizonana TaxID=38151 RepID=A0A1B6DFB3_9HEMI
MQCGEKRVVCDIPALSLLHEEKAITSNLLLSLKCKECCDSNLVGGKASSLALLNIATSTNLKYKAIVPEGFCLTVNAMKIQIDNSDLIKAILEDLDVAVCDTETINLQEVCQNVVTCWRRMPICEELLDEIIKLIEPNRSYAVRSSGIGEDSVVLSAAGQNATILGCQGIDGIVYGIKECWASLYTFQSVEYRRQLGMALDCGMGVIIQEMVSADAAGVMFTRHPVSGDPDLVYVTANFGLGETVVSGSVEPDSFVVSKQDGLNLKIVSSDRGKKGRMLHMLENGALVNTSTEEINLCISNHDLLNLVKVGIEIEEMFGWPKDIEWTLHKGRIYLLQCRPITSLFAWSEQELTHELDSALLDDIFTTANVGEVFPEATSPLTQSVCLRVLNKFIMKEDRRNKNLWYNNDVVCISHHHALINTLKTFLRYVDKKTSFSQKVLELAVCGHPVSNEILLSKVESKIGFMSFWNHLSLIFGNISDTISNKSTVRSAQKLGNNFKLSFNQCTTAASLIRVITSSFVHLQEVLVYHSQASTVSVFWQMILLSILSEGNADLTSSHLEDVSQLLLSSEIVVSAEIPKLLKEISNVIIQDGNFKDFNRTPVKNTRNWLQTNCKRASKMFENLLHTHGHRSIKEMDLKTETWGLDPTPLLITLKSLVKNSSRNKKVNISESEMKSKVFKSPKKEITRFFLKMLQPYSNRAAEGREVTKNAMLLIIHQLRLAYLHLGKLMMKEGKLPDPSLVFYFTHYELMVFISTEESSILHKASRRKRLWPKWNQIKFPEIIDGFLTPLSIDISKIGEGNQVKGTLVFPGQVQGRACVLSLGDDPSVINQGDILITYCTDVGWSPLYPLLGGVVTELGGLISHGAVVAREYGLPCIVGASGVTTVFQTGDEILLDANNGVVTKLSGTKRE